MKAASRSSSQSQSPVGRLPDLVAFSLPPLAPSPYRTLCLSICGAESAQGRLAGLGRSVVPLALPWRQVTWSIRDHVVKRARQAARRRRRWRRLTNSLLMRAPLRPAEAALTGAELLPVADRAAEESRGPMRGIGAARALRALSFPLFFR